MNIIEAKELNKVYCHYEKQPGLINSVKSLFHREYVQKHAVSDFELCVRPGEFVGLIGPNGAGKTTLIKMLTGIIPPTSGELSVLGYFPNKLENAFKRQYAVVMGQKSQLFFELTAADTFLLFKQLYEVPEQDYRRNLAYLVDLFDVGEQLNVPVRTLSLGERMKMELIASLLHSPLVLFLDEPTIGLDAVAQRQMRGFLREVNRDMGTTILLTSHYIEDIKSLCPRCVVIGSGRKLYDGALDALFQRYQHSKKITVRYESPHRVELPGGVRVLSQTPYRLELQAPRQDVQPLLRALIEHGEVSDISVEEEEIGLVVERIYA